MFSRSFGVSIGNYFILTAGLYNKNKQKSHQVKKITACKSQSVSTVRAQMIC